MEYFGPGVFSQSCTGKYGRLLPFKPGFHASSGLATIANMGAEVGATTSTFPYTPNMRAYLNATGRSPVARAANEVATQYLCADEGAEYDEVISVVCLSFFVCRVLIQRNVL